MSNKPPLSEFLTEIAAVLQVVSQGVLHAVVALAARTAQFAKDVAIAIANLCARMAKVGWQTYCRLESSIVDALAATVLVVWSLRPILLGIAIGVLLFVYVHWIALVVYLAVVILAIVLYYTRSAEEVQHALAELAPIRSFVTTILRWGLRAILLAMTLGSAVQVYSSSSAETISKLKEYIYSTFRRPSDGHAVDGDSPAGLHKKSAAASATQSPSASLKVPPSAKSEYRHASAPPIKKVDATERSAESGLPASSQGNPMAPRVRTYVLNGRVKTTHDGAGLFRTLLPLPFSVGTKISMEVVVRADSPNIWRKDTSVGSYRAEKAIVRVGDNEPIITREPMQSVTVSVQPHHPTHGSTFTGGNSSLSCQDCIYIQASFQLLNATPGYITSAALPIADLDATAFGQGPIDRNITLILQNSRTPNASSDITAHVESIQVR